MSKYLLSIIFLFCSCNNHTDNDRVNSAACAKFKKGIFLYRVDGSDDIFKIERRDSIQRETIAQTGDYVDLKIKWEGDCAYELSFLDQHMLQHDSVPTIFKNTVVKVKIVRIQNDSCFIVANDGKSDTKGIIYIKKK